MFILKFLTCVRLSTLILHLNAFRKIGCFIMRQALFTWVKKLVLCNNTYSF